ncbi:MAG TPA: hypothetical protein VHX65_07925 [Pirellulales bacterium]|nr:hypothetical protein [Pirellulales bacterium]
MKRGWLAALLAAATVLPMAARGADDTKTPDAPPAKTATSTTTPTKLKGRLPPFYAKLPVDTQQKEKIYAIQAEFAPQIKTLHQQLAKLEADESAQIKAVLTPEQQEKLKELMAESRHHGKAPASKTAPPAAPSSTAPAPVGPNAVPAPPAK